MMRLEFVVPGEPVAKGRPRVTARGGRARAYTPARTRAYEALVADCARLAAETAGGWEVGRRVPLRVTVEAIHARPGRLFRVSDDAGRTPRVARPDVDNVAKAILDGLDQSGIWGDDAQVVDLVATKRHAAILDRKARTTEAPHVRVVVEVLVSLEGL
jgi:Holliday junction resolvase RusA-like endonuclease